MFPDILMKDCWVVVGLFSFLRRMQKEERKEKSACMYLVLLKMGEFLKDSYFT